MKYIWGSDLHLDHLRGNEFNEFIARVKAECVDPDTVLLLTGDTSVGTQVSGHHYALADAAAGRMLYVLGNHDRWGSSFADVDVKLEVTSVHMPRASFMDKVDYVELDPGTFAVGDSGWYDGRNGTQGNPRMIMNDWNYIHEYIGREPYKASAEFADARAKTLDTKMRAAIAAGAERLVVLTHAPPFVESCRYMGNPSDLYALPWFSSQVFGDTLDQVANEHWSVQIEVLCGHTHDRYVYKRCDNLMVHVAGAKYGDPQTIEWKPTLW